MMMLMICRFVERILNSPQTRCQSQSNRWVEMTSERQRRECCGSKGSWQTVSDVWASDCKTPHPQCCRRPWHEQCSGVSRPEMLLAGDSRNWMTVIDQVNWRQFMKVFVYCHGELVLDPLAMADGTSPEELLSERMWNSHVLPGSRQKHFLPAAVGKMYKWKINLSFCRN